MESQVTAKKITARKINKEGVLITYWSDNTIDVEATLDSETTVYVEALPKKYHRNLGKLDAYDIADMDEAIWDSDDDSDDDEWDD